MDSWYQMRFHLKRMIALISESDALEIIQESLLLQAISEGFVSDAMIAIDATHVAARDRAPFRSDKAKKMQKNEGVKRKKSMNNR